MGSFDETMVERKEIYSGKILRLCCDRVRLCDGSTAAREIVEHGGAVCVLPVTEKGRALLVRQFRYPAGTELLEAPAGRLEKGENPLSAAKRELLEETGCVAENWTDLGFIYPTAGYSTERIYLYLACGLQRGEACPDEGEFLELEEIELEKLFKMAAVGEITDGKTVCAVFRGKEFLQNGRNK